MSDIDIPWLLLAVPLAFALGWLGSRFDLRQVKREARDAPRAYFQGLNLLLNEQHDKAIDAFIEAVQHDPETAELHFALGSLFRRRGEFERAIRVHEHLLRRGDLKPADRARAQHALAQDFMKAGLFDRAEASFRALMGTAYASEARLALLSLLERSREWDGAAAVALELEASGTASFARRRAHYECERAIEADAREDKGAALAALERAHQTAPDAPRPGLLAGQLARKAGDHAAALAHWDLLRQQHPASFALVAEAYAQSALEAGRAAQARPVLAEALQAQPSAALLRALMKLDEACGEDSLPLLLEQLQRQPGLGTAQLLLQQAPQRWGEAGLQALRQSVALAATPLQRYRCAACGFEAQHYFWQCPGCLTWDSFPPQTVEAA